MTLTKGQQLRKGDRVLHHPDGGVGYVENIDPAFPEFADVRWQTPNNTPSCCISICHIEHLEIVDAGVVPMKKNRTWWKAARAFQRGIERALREAGI